MSYMTSVRPFPHKKTTISQKGFLYITLFYSVRAFARIRQHYFSKYWGDGCMGRPPPHILRGTVPPVPPRSPPLLRRGITRSSRVFSIRCRLYLAYILGAILKISVCCEQL